MKSAELAEIIGIMLGDGCLYLDTKNKYQTAVAFNKKELQYLEYVKELFENYFKPYSFCVTEIKDEFLLRNTSVRVGMILIGSGLMAGSKVHNKPDIPNWIFEDYGFLLAFLRGIFDTDGCVYRKYGNYAQIQFKLACRDLVYSIRKALAVLDFNPSSVQKENYMGRDSWKIYLARQKEIDKFFGEIKPMNLKHIFRHKKIRKGMNGAAGI